MRNLLSWLEKYWQSSSQAKLLVIACAVFAFLDIATTVACVEISDYPQGEGNILFRWVFMQMGVWWSIIPMALAKFALLVFVCYGSMRAIYEQRRVYILVFPLVYLIAHALVVGFNLAGLQILLQGGY